MGSQTNFDTGAATSSSFISALAYSPEASNAINSVYQDELGRPVSPSEIAIYISEITSGFTTLEDEVSTIAYGPEAAADLEGALNALFGDFPSPSTLTTYQADLAVGQGVPGILDSIIGSSSGQSALAQDYYLTTGLTPGTNDLNTLTTNLYQDVADTAPLNWSTVVLSVGNGLLSFLSQLNPIGSAVAQEAHSGQNYSGYDIYNPVAGNKYGGVYNGSQGLPGLSAFSSAAANGTPLQLFENNLQIPTPNVSLADLIGIYGFHQFYVQGTQSFPTAAAAFQDILNHPAGHLLTDFSSSGGVQSGQEVLSKSVLSRLTSTVSTWLYSMLQSRCIF